MASCSSSNCAPINPLALLARSFTQDNARCIAARILDEDTAVASSESQEESKQEVKVASSNAISHLFPVEEFLSWNQNIQQSALSSSGEAPPDWLREYASMYSPYSNLSHSSSSNRVMTHNEINNSIADEWVQEYEREQQQQSYEDTWNKKDGFSSSTHDLLSQLQNHSDNKIRNMKIVGFLTRLKNGENVFDDLPSSSVVNSALPNSPHSSPANDSETNFDSEFHLNALLSDYEMYNKEVKQVEDALLIDLSSNKRTFEYTFAPPENNPFSSAPDSSSIARHLVEEGNLSDAVLAFEAALVQYPDDSENWRLLGQCHADNENDVRAIAALIKAMSLDPRNLDTLLQLCISYTNEALQTEAIYHLCAWVEEMFSLEPQEREMLARYQHQEDDNIIVNFAETCTGLLAILDSLHQKSPNNPDLCIAIGTLHCISGENDHASRFFEVALQFRPRDSTLLNRLAVAKANGFHSEEAITLYQKALSIRPNYLRAEANLGIAYANLGLHLPAVKTYIQALCKNPRADNIWGYLRLSLHVLDRDDLVQLSMKNDPQLLQTRIEEESKYVVPSPSTFPPFPL